MAGAVVRDWSERGFSCDAFTELPAQEWRDFVYNTNELVTVIDGKRKVHMHDAAYLLEPGNELFIPRGTLHTVRNVHRGATRRLSHRVRGRSCITTSNIN